MAQPIQTHINAFYTELATAKRELAVAQQRVIELEDAIIGRGYDLPDANTAEEEVGSSEDTATSDDVSASEEKRTRK
jgi:hypothetical protein